MKLTAPDYVILIVEDLDRALQFYTEVLGLRLGHRSGDYAQLDTGATRLALYTRSAMAKTLGMSLEMPSSNAPGFEIGFKVGDVDAAVDEDAWRPLVAIEAKLVGALARSPTGTNQHLVAFSEISVFDRLVHLVGGNLMLFRSSDIEDHRVSENQPVKRDLVQGPGKFGIRLQGRRIKRHTLMGNHERAAGFSIEFHPRHPETMFVIYRYSESFTDEFVNGKISPYPAPSQIGIVKSIIFIVIPPQLRLCR